MLEARQVEGEQVGSVEKTDTVTDSSTSKTKAKASVAQQVKNQPDVQKLAHAYRCAQGELTKMQQQMSELNSNKLSKLVQYLHMHPLTKELIAMVITSIKQELLKTKIKINNKIKIQISIIIRVTIIPTTNNVQVEVEVEDMVVGEVSENKSEIFQESLKDGPDFVTGVGTMFLLKKQTIC